MDTMKKMFPKVEKIARKDDESLFVGHYKNKWFERSLHYHSEFELLLIIKGYGKRVIGNSSASFKEGDLVLLGSDIPHAWFSDPIFFNTSNELECESIYIQFDRAIFGTRFANLPEMQSIQTLLNHAKFGLKHKATNCCELIDTIKKIHECTGLDRILNLLRILDLFQQGKYTTLVPKSYFNTSRTLKSTRLKKVHEYVMNNYMDNLNVSEAARIAEMNVSSFCRYFKKMSNKTFSQYVKETRIDYAQQLLINTNLTSNQIGFECGFSSVAYFNQCFKSISGKTPLEYRSAYKIV